MSKRTSADLVLSGNDDGTYRYIARVGYEFVEPLDETQLVCITTCSANLRDRLTGEFLNADVWSVLADFWYFPRRDRFAEIAAAFLKTIFVGFEGVDEHGMRFNVPWQRVALDDLPVERWHEYVTFLENDEMDIADCYSEIRIARADLKALQGSSSMLSSVAKLSMGLEMNLNVDDRFCFWYSPIPCYVESFSVRTEGLAFDEGGTEFRVVPYLGTDAVQHTEWMAGDTTVMVEVNAWLLPGQGFAVLWREC